MKRILFILVPAIIAISSTFTLSQSLEFRNMYLEPDTIRNGKFKNHEAYDLGYLMLYKKLKKAEKFVIADRSTDVELFSFINDITDGFLRKPVFFMSGEANQPIIMLADVSDLYNYGVHVFLIDDTTVRHCGFIGYAADNFNFSSLSLYSHFEKVDDRIIMTLDDNDYIDHANEELIPGGDLKFEIINHTVQRIVEK